jgi:hypothetical protein
VKLIGSGSPDGRLKQAQRTQLRLKLVEATSLVTQQRLHLKRAAQLRPYILRQISKGYIFWGSVQLRSHLWRQHSKGCIFRYSTQLLYRLGQGGGW